LVYNIIETFLSFSKSA